MIAHELHHSSRIRTGPGYGTLLGEAMVTEGLADTFALEVVEGAPRPPWVDALTPEQLLAVWQVARDEIWSRHDHAEWFFGAGEVPRWAGYTIGFDAVDTYLRATPGRTAASSVSVNAQDVLDPYEP